MPHANRATARRLSRPPPADRAALYRALTQVSQLMADVPEVIELDINPLLVSEHGVIALDARLRVAEPKRQAQRG